MSKYDFSFAWWKFKSWFHRCPECGKRPNGFDDASMPRWENDKVAAMLGIQQYGCRRCGGGAIEGRDRIADGGDCW